MKNIDIVLGSKSKLKYDALDSTLKELYPYLNYTISTYSVESDVPEQPFDDQGITGARNRAKGGLKIFCEENGRFPDYVIAIENFLQAPLLKDEKYSDKAAIVIFNFDTEGNYEEDIVYSQGVEFESKYVERALMEGVTCGIIMEREGIVKQHDDPHLDLVGISRADILKEALVSHFKQTDFFFKKENEEDALQRLS